MSVESRKLLIERFLDVVDRHAERTAVHDHGRDYSYIEFYACVLHLYDRLGDHDGVHAVGIYAGRSLLFYAGMWACILRGISYVPLNPSLPDERISKIIELADIGCILSDNRQAFEAKNCAYSGVCFACDLDNVSMSNAPYNFTVDAQNIAYILFTSGSTGVPKGVPISYENLYSFVDNIFEIFDYSEHDRYAQVSEPSFDFSVHEIFAGLLSGGCLYPARAIDLFNPVHYINSHGLTVWHSVPSLAQVSLSNNMLKSQCLSSLRLSIFNGEPLTRSLAQSWQDASAVQHDIWNTYGPTECTVAVFSQLVKQDEEGIFDGNNIAIGVPFKDCDIALLVGDAVIGAQDFGKAMTGELLLAGSQKFSGYLNGTGSNPFVHNESGTQYYKTGDRVRWQDGRVFHIGRIDYQVKVGGYRIELLEIEHHMKLALESEDVVVLAIPEDQPKLLVLCTNQDCSMSDVKQKASALPHYMMPKKLVRVSSFPRNANGKIDRKAMLELVSDEVDV